jgi:hypothetical protein
MDSAARRSYIVAKIIERTQKGLAKASHKRGQMDVVLCAPRLHLTGCCKAGGVVELLQAYYVIWAHNALDFICLKRNKAFASFDEPDGQAEVTSVCVCKGRYM